jgi:NAD(P)-dependent dehydrogenase (short-subunit alcohol dehydrogenase family)
MTSLEGTVALVTGASRGIGAAVARSLDEHGVRLGLASRSGDDPGLRRWYGAGRLDGSCYFGQEDERGYLRPLADWTYGVIAIQFGEMARGRHPPSNRRRNTVASIRSSHPPDTPRTRTISSSG